MEYYLVDKFNRGYKPEPVVQKEYKGAVGEGLELLGNNWNAKKRKIGNVKKGTLSGDVVTFDQALTSDNGQEFVFNGRQYLLIPKGSDFDMNKYRFKNLSEGVDEGDAITAGQLVRYLNDIRNRLHSIEDLGKLYSITKTYFSTKGRRIVGVRPGIDKNDVVIKQQLDAVKSKSDSVEKKLDDLLKGIEVTDDCIKIKNHHRICDLSKGVNPYDAVALVQLDEFNKKMVLFQNEFNEKIRLFHDKINELSAQIVQPKKPA